MKLVDSRQPSRVDILAKDIPPDQYFYATSAMGRRHLYYKIGGSVINLQYAGGSYSSYAPSVVMSDYEPVEVTITVMN